MLTYILRRILIGFFTLGVITFLLYGLVRAMPGDPIVQQLQNANPDRPPDPAEIERQRKIYGLDKPWAQAYFIWMANVCRGDLGRSMSPGRGTVVHAIGERVLPTLWLTTTSLFLTYLLSIPLGLYATVRSGKFEERVLGTILYMLYSLPAFVAAVLLQVLFALYLSETAFGLPLFRMVDSDYEQLSSWGKCVDILKHSILPITCFTYGSLAYYSRFIRANMQEVIRQDYIRTARAKGVGPLRVLLYHAFRNTLIPLVTMIGLTLPSLLSGAIILEQIFSWPGMGSLFFESIRERDYPVLMALVLMFAVLTLIGQLLADIFYALVDPRITYK